MSEIYSALLQELRTRCTEHRFLFGGTKAPGHLYGIFIYRTDGSLDSNAVNIGNMTVEKGTITLNIDYSKFKTVDKRTYKFDLANPTSIDDLCNAINDSLITRSKPLVTK